MERFLPECCAVHDFMTDRLLQGTGIEQIGDGRSKIWASFFGNPKKFKISLFFRGSNSERLVSNWEVGAQNVYNVVHSFIDYTRKEKR